MKKLLVSSKYYSEKSFKKIKRLKSLQKAKVYLEPIWTSTMELFWEYINSFIFSQYKLHHRCSTGLYIGLWKCWDFQSETQVEQIIEIVQRIAFLVKCSACLMNLKKKYFKKK